MTTLHHAIKISAPRDSVFKALTVISELANWHYGPVEGEVAVGSVMRLNARPGMRFGWKTLELTDGRHIKQECVEGPGATGKQITFDLSTTDDGLTLVELSDGDWEEGDAHMAFCNTHWGGVLHRLKKYVEGS